MRIALVARHVTPPVHPVDLFAAEEAAHVRDLGHALAGQGHDVVIYVRKDSPKLPKQAALAPRLTVEYIPAGPAAPVTADQLPKHIGEMGDYLAASWKRSTPGIVHAHHWTSGLAALLAARERPVPIVASFGSLGGAERRHGLASAAENVRLKMETCIARSVAGLIAGTSDEVSELARLGIPGSRVRLVPCGVDTSKFSQEGPAAKRNGQPRLIHVGSLAPHQGLETLLRALPELPGAELVIVGGPAADDLDSDAGYKKLGKLAAGLGVADRVSFTGDVSEDDLPALLRSADALVSAASYEPLGGPVVRAMSCGVPVIAPAIGGYADAVIDGTTGVLLPPGRPEALAKLLRDLLATPMRMSAFGIAAADRAKSRYPWERIATETVAAYERTIALAGARAAGASVSVLPAGRPAQTRLQAA